MKLYFIPLVLIISFIVFSVIHKISKNKRPFKRAFISLLSGLLSLIAVDVLSIFTGVYIPISVLSILTAIVLGIPGVTSMLCLNLIL